MHDATCIVRVDFFNTPAVLFIEKIESRALPEFLFFEGYSFSPFPVPAFRKL